MCDQLPVSRYFSLSPAETLKSWTMSASLIGLTGFMVTLLLSQLLS